jgi:hypothetical protein
MIDLLELGVLTTLQSTDMTWQCLSRYPYVTGASVLAIKYKQGVLIACDMLGATLQVTCVGVQCFVGSPHMKPQGDDDQKT